MEKENPLLECFNELIDPRRKTHSSRHLMIDILMLTIIAVICGAESWVAVERFGCSKQEWLKGFLGVIKSAVETVILSV